MILWHCPLRAAYSLFCDDSSGCAFINHSLLHSSITGTLELKPEAANISQVFVLCSSLCGFLGPTEPPCPTDFVVARTALVAQNIHPARGCARHRRSLHPLLSLVWFLFHLQAFKGFPDTLGKCFHQLCYSKLINFSA